MSIALGSADGPKMDASPRRPLVVDRDYRQARAAAIVRLREGLDGGRPRSWREIARLVSQPSAPITFMGVKKRYESLLARHPRVVEAIRAGRL
jgi:hypothetical protein